MVWNGMKQHEIKVYLRWDEFYYISVKYCLMNGFEIVFNWLKTNLNDANTILFVLSLSGWDTYN